MRFLFGPRHSNQYIAYCLLMSFFVCKNSLYSYITSAIRRIPLIGIGADFIVVFTLIVLGLIAFNKTTVHHIKLKDYLVPVFVILSLVFTMLIYPENTEYIEYNFGHYIAYCIPAFFVGLCCIKFDDYMFRFLSIISCISVISSYLFSFMYVSSFKVIVDELGQSYNVLLSTLVIGSYFAFSKKKSFLIFYALGVIYHVSLGSRGPILCLLVHGIICVFITSTANISKKVLLAILTGIIVVLLLETNMYRDLLIVVRNALISRGYSSRVIDYAISGEFVSHTSGRDLIYKRLIELLKERPLFGYGLFGEWQFINWNAHELYLEIVFEYGLLVGIPLILWFVNNIIPTFLRDKDMASKLFISALITYVMVQGIMSYSHLRPELFLLLGFCIRQRRLNRSIAA